MGRQFRFLMDYSTEDELLNFILKKVNLLFEGDLKFPLRIYEFPERFSGKGWFQIYLYNPEWGELKYINLQNGRTIIDSSNSPVIELMRTIIREDAKEVSQGRIWFEPKYRDNDHQMQHKSEQLVKFYGELIKWIKKEIPIISFQCHGYEYKESIGPTILKLVESGYKIY